MSDLKKLPYVTVEQVLRLRKAALSRIEELEAKVQELEAAQRWIPVSEGLPEQKQPVDVIIKCYLNRSFQFPSGSSRLVWVDEEHSAFLPLDRASDWRYSLPTPPEVEQ